ncbi:MAG: site-specific DNA-methyltransferase [Bacteroidetes bacterium]|nr:site-specific DNA-methyltransferase [Bacteroidota bacterium]
MKTKRRLLKNMIYNESCLNTMAKMPDNFIDLTITSPPYDNLRTYINSVSGIKSKFNGYNFPFEEIAKELFRVTAKGGVVVWVVSDATTNGSETGTSFKQALYFKEIGFKLFDTMIYSKPPRGAVGNNKTYWQSFEYMFIFSKGSPKTINLIIDRENKESREGDNGTKRLQNGDLLQLKRGGYGKFGRRTNIWEYNIGKGHSTRDSIAHGHPAIFPEKLALDHITTWSNEGDLVYDPMIGSGTVAKMCIMENRNYIGSEINKPYCEIAEKRISMIKEKINKQENAEPGAIISIA